MPDMFVNERNEEAMRKREANVRAQHVAAFNAKKRSNTAKVVTILGLGGGCAWLVFSNGMLANKLARQPVVYAALQANGEVISSTHYSEVPPAAKQEEAVQNALWTYVQARDCYGSSAPLRQYYIALAMSDERIGKQVKDEFSMQNPQAPQKIYGEKNITVQCDLVDPPTPIGDLSNNLYFFRFRRWEQTPRSTPADVALAAYYTVTVRFRTGIYPESDPRRAWLDRSTFNAPGVQVIDYPGAKPSGVQK